MQVILMIKKNNKDFEMQAYLKTCKENGIVLEKTNNKIKSNIILVSETGKRYYVSKDMSVSVIPRPARRKPLKNGEFKKAISHQSE
jgi:hypothetical protein